METHKQSSTISDHAVGLILAQYATPHGDSVGVAVKVVVVNSDP
jgi:hypothetical protein